MPAEETAIAASSSAYVRLGTEAFIFSPCFSSSHLNRRASPSYIGAPGFEPRISGSQGRRDTRLRYAPCAVESSQRRRSKSPQACRRERNEVSWVVMVRTPCAERPV